MGISAGGRRHGPKSDLNVTPMVDVCLVLLIIFMVTMPILMRHITIEVPRKLDQDEELSPTSNQITLLGKADGSILITDGSGERSINRVDLAKTLHDLLDSRKTEKVIFVDFEDSVKYIDAVSIMDTIKGTGKMLGDGVREDVKVALKIREEGAPVAP